MNLYSAEDVLDAAHTIQPHLPRLLGADAASLGTALSELLTEAETGAAVDRRVLSLLAAREPTRTWLDFYLNGPRRPAAATLRSVGYAAPPGISDAAPAQKYACPSPDCPYQWCCRAVGQTVPRCPDHGEFLAPIPR